MAKKRGKGRPRLGAAAKSESERVRITKAELVFFKREAARLDTTVGALILRPWRRKEG